MKENARRRKKKKSNQAVYNSDIEITLEQFKSIAHNAILLKFILYFEFKTFYRI